MPLFLLISLVLASSNLVHDQNKKTWFDWSQVPHYVVINFWILVDVNHTSVNPVHNAPVELPLARSFLARAPHPARSFLARAPSPLARAGPPPTPCFTRLSLPPPPKTLHKEREPMGLSQESKEVRDK
jgi:hypothetical protein